MRFWLYIVANKRNGTLYVGVTNDITRRAYEHRQALIPGFTKRYGLNLLVFAEEFASIRDAREAEARIKKWRRTWKLALIEKHNPKWLDLYETFP
jgi:putative endonuclease